MAKQTQNQQIMTTIRTHFIIFYFGRNNKGNLHGNCALELKSKFPNRIEITQYIKDNFNIIDLVITNIIQVTKSEFDEWCRK